MLSLGHEKPVLLIQTPPEESLSSLEGKAIRFISLVFYICLLLTEMKTQAIWPPTEGTGLPRSFQKRYVTVSHEAQQRPEESQWRLICCHAGHMWVTLPQGWHGSFPGLTLHIVSVFDGFYVRPGFLQSILNGAILFMLVNPDAAS